MKRSKAMRLVMVVLFLGLAAGCGNRGPKTYPIAGVVELSGGDVRCLAGCHLEAVSENDAAVRASGTIQPDGRFNLEMLHQGAIRKGAPAGSYRVRLILNDDDPTSQRRASAAVDQRYLSFESSGLALQAPAPERVVLKVSSR